MSRGARVGGHRGRDGPSTTWESKALTWRQITGDARGGNLDVVEMRQDSSRYAGPKPSPQNDKQVKTMTTLSKAGGEQAKSDLSKHMNVLVGWERASGDQVHRARDGQRTRGATKREADRLYGGKRSQAVKEPGSAQEGMIRTQTCKHQQMYRKQSIQSKSAQRADDKTGRGTKKPK